MAGKGAPKGNQYAAKERVWARAIDLALEERGGQLGKMGALKELAGKLLNRAAEGDITSLKELGDRLDGKAPQALEVDAKVVADVTASERPQISKEEWLSRHGVG